MMKLLIGFALLAISAALPVEQFSFPGKPTWSDFGLSDKDLSEDLGGLPLLEPVLLKNPEDILKGFKLDGLVEKKDAPPAAESSSSEEDKEEESSSEEAAPSKKKSSSEESSSSEKSNSEEPAAAAPTEEAAAPTEEAAAPNEEAAAPTEEAAAPTEEAAAPTEEAAPAPEAKAKEAEVASKGPEAHDKPIANGFQIPFSYKMDLKPLKKYFKKENANNGKKHHRKRSRSIFNIRR